MTDIFISYAAADRAYVAALARALEARKWRVFWDRDIPPGRKWQDVLRVQLTGAKCVIAVITRDALNSSWVAFEAGVALHQDKLVPVLADPNLNPRSDLPGMYHELHVAALPADHAEIAHLGPQEPWLRAVDATIRRAIRRRVLHAALVVAACAFVALSLTYIAVTAHNALMTWQAGLRYIERGAYSKPENERLKAAIRQASLVEILVPNAVSFTGAFRDDLPVFLRRKDSRMRVLFADPAADFYKDMMTMTNPGFAHNDAARASDLGLPGRSRQILLDFAGGDAQKLQFRKFTDEFRAPVILIDRKLCFLTVRLTPDQSVQSLRLELAGESAGTGVERFEAATLKSLSSLVEPDTEHEDNIESCKRHFDAVWARSAVVD